jgi:hypothetical protein
MAIYLNCFGGKMPANSEEKGYKNLTLRLPDDYHRQLVAQADRSGLTLNGHLLNVVRRHLMDSGYYPYVIKSFSGRLFEVSVTEISRSKNPGHYFSSRFDLTEHHPLYSKRRARYVFGIASPIVYGEDPFGAVKDIGLGLLNFFNRQGLEIDQLAWQNAIGDPLPPEHEGEDNWRYIGTGVCKSAAEFLLALGRNHWKDQLLIITGESQDIRYHRRSEDDLFARELPNLVQGQAEFERWAYADAKDWIRQSSDAEPAQEYSGQRYIVLPGYVREQIEPDQYHDILRRCWEYLSKQRK